MTARIALSLLLILASRPAEAGRYLSAIAVAVGSTAGNPTPKPPSPSPSGECDNCGGTGRLGDGTVSVDCPLCVDGKVTTAVARSAAKPAEHLTLRSEGQPAKSTRDGQLTPGGQLRWSAARAAWIPVDLGNTHYTENGHQPTARHMIETHGHDPSSALKWTQREINIAHANAHAPTSRRMTVVSETSESACPNGKCGNPGLFGRILGRR